MFIASIIISVLIYLVVLVLIRKTPKARKAYVDLLYDNDLNPISVFVVSFVFLFILIILLLCFPMLFLPLYILIYFVLRISLKMRKEQEEHEKDNK